MQDVRINPIDTKGKATIMDAFPDTGCQQSLIAEDLIGTCGLILETHKKKQIKAVDGGKVPCSGSTTFQVTYNGHTTNVLALVTPALNGEIILSWRALQRLGVIPKNFPSPSQSHVIANMSKTLATSKSPKNGNVPEDTIDLNESLDELKDKYESVFKIGDELKTMKGKPMRIELVENVPIKPLHVNTPR